VWIDWQRREVRVQARVVLRAGVLEFLACWPGKEHESILRFEAPAAHVYMALGLIGLTPGHPPMWVADRGAYASPTGDLLDISVEWQSDGQVRTADAYDWLHEIEYGRVPLSRPWVFAGSLRLPDGTLAADASGVGIALVDFSDSLICFSRRYSSQYESLWAEANTEAIPPEGTPVRLILRPAQMRPLSVTVDFRGVVWVNGRYCSAADLADLLGLARQLSPTQVQDIAVVRTLESDLLDWREKLVQAGLTPDAFHLVRTSSATRPADPPPIDE
jgi:hypothetical protein